MSSSRPRALRSLQQAGDRAGRWRRSWPAARVFRPPCWSQSWQLDRFDVTGVIDLHEAHAALDQPPGHQALLAEDLRRLVVEPVELLRRPATRAPTSNASGASRLHPEGQLERRDPGVELAVLLALLAVQVVEALQRVELVRSAAPATPADFSDWRWGSSGRRRACPGRRRAGSWSSTAARPGPAARADDDEAGQVLVLAAQAVEQPRAEAGPRKRLLARVHLQAGAVVVDVVGDHRADDADVVDAAGRRWGTGR